MKRIAILFCIVVFATIAGCSGPQSGNATAPEAIQDTLPEKITIHSFSEPQTDSSGKKISSIDLRLVAEDAYGDATKALGTFRFEMYSFRRHNLDPRDERITTWTIQALEKQTNTLYYDDISRMYRFNLRLPQAIPADKRFVIVAVFQSPYTKRLMDTRRFNVD